MESKMEKQWHTCSLCHGKFFGYGNNPEPIKRFEERCCDDCNARRVIPRRIAKLYGKDPKIDGSFSRVLRKN